ncbi:MAG: hypothetical protein INH41_08010 [Myxococcaceae bacterium]|nr:hypothetical protein [Myxococcaceae bacterium]
MEEYRRAPPEKFMDVEYELSRFIGWVEGRREGRQAGREEARRSLADALLASFSVRFGAAASDELRVRLARANMPTLARWLVRARTARGPGDVFAEP